MDPVQITMLGVGVALAALIVTMNGSLRRDMDKRFEGVDKRFDAIEKRFDDRIDGIEKRFEERFDGIDKRLDGIDKRLDGIDARLRLVEQGLAEVKGGLAFVESFILGRTETAEKHRPERPRPSSGAREPPAQPLSASGSVPQPRRMPPTVT